MIHFLSSYNHANIMTDFISGSSRMSFSRYSNFWSKSLVENHQLHLLHLYMAYTTHLCSPHLNFSKTYSVRNLHFFIYDAFPVCAACLRLIKNISLSIKSGVLIFTRHDKHGADIMTSNKHLELASTKYKGVALCLQCLDAIG